MACVVPSATCGRDGFGPKQGKNVKTMKIIHLIISMMIFVSCSCFGDEVKATIVEYGLYTDLDIIGRAKTGAREWYLASEKHLETTTHVPCKYGVSFGYRFQIDGHPESDTITYGILLPPEGGQAKYFASTRTYEETVANPFIGYRLDADGPTPCGTYVLVIAVGDRKLCEQSFEVYSENGIRGQAISE